MITSSSFGTVGQTLIDPFGQTSIGIDKDGIANLLADLLSRVNHFKIVDDQDFLAVEIVDDVRQGFNDGIVAKLVDLLSQLSSKHGKRVGVFAVGDLDPPPVGRIILALWN